MANPVVHFEIMGKDGAALQKFYADLFGWTIDASIVRMVLVPATMELLGNANWWLPKWLDRAVPRISVDAPPDFATLRPTARAPEQVGV